jgi:cell division protein FtsQ
MSEAVYNRSRRRNTTVERSGFAHYGLVLTTIALGALAYFLFIFVITPYTRISRIYVHADFDISQERLLAATGLSAEDHYFSIQTSVLSERVATIPMVKSAQVERVFPNALRITMERRRPVALMLVSQDGQVLPAVVDEEGMIFDQSPALARLDLPIISGLEFQGSVVGTQLPSVLQTFLESLHRLRVESPRLYERISEFHVVPRRSGGVDLLMHLSDYPVPVRLENRITTELSTWSLMVLDVISQKGLDATVVEVDVRSGEIVYRLKEDADGR